MSDHSVQLVTPVARSGSAGVGAVLGRAFHDDPLWNAAFRDPESRLTKLTNMFTALSKATASARGLVEATPGFTGAALWMPPGREIGSSAMVRSGFALPRFVASLPRTERALMLGVLRQFEKWRKSLAPAMHWYLAAVGVDPSHHGQGLGSAMLRLGMRRADEHETPIYLETETESNVEFYRHLGFEVLEETVAVGLDLPVWLMSRGPGAGE